MASSLAETIGSDFLTCGVCLESYKDPRVLPCHHGFCRQCLERAVASSEDTRTLGCPTCRKTLRITEETVKDLPVYFLVKSLKGAVEMDRVVKRPSQDTICCNCDCDASIPNKANVRCLDCKQYLCDPCHAPHKILKTMRNHRVFYMEDILSGKVNLQAEEKTICEFHQEYHKYYCKEEKRAVCKECIILKTCPNEHDRITLGKAAQEKLGELEDLVKQANEILKTCHDSVNEMDDIEKELEIHSQTAKDTLAKVQEDYINLVKKTVKGFEDEIDNVKKIRRNELERKKMNLKSIMEEIEKANEVVSQVIQSPYKMEVISSHTTLSTKLETLVKSQLLKVDEKLGYVKFEAAMPSNPNIGQLLKRKQWNLTGQFSTGNFKKLFGLAVDQDDNIVVCSWDQGVKVFTRDGDVKSTLYNSPGSVDVCVLPGKRYVTAPLGIREIRICNSQGQHAIFCPVLNVNNAAVTANSVTVDSNNKIIVGHATNTISIHNADGSLMSKIATQCITSHLAATSNGKIVRSVFDSNIKRRSVQLMDYSGGSIRVIQPPDEVNAWVPGFVCCGQGEIFVTNQGGGDPCGVYRYTSEGEFLGCVTTQVRNPGPGGIALSRDGMELFVSDRSVSVVKIFQRP